MTTAEHVALLRAAGHDQAADLLQATITPPAAEPDPDPDPQPEGLRDLFDRGLRERQADQGQAA